MNNLQMIGGLFLVASPLVYRLFNHCKKTVKPKTTVISGAFEIHLTVASDKPGDQEKFTEVCKKIGVKPVYILLPHGDFPKQLMTSSYTTGTRDDAI